MIIIGRRHSFQDPADRYVESGKSVATQKIRSGPIEVVCNCPPARSSLAMTTNCKTVSCSVTKPRATISPAFQFQRRAISN